MSPHDDRDTPPSPFPSGDKIDLVIGMVREISRDLKRTLTRLSDAEIKLAEHGVKIENIGSDVHRIESSVAPMLRSTRKVKLEPNWWLRAVAIAVLTAVASIIVNFLAKGGFSAGVT